VTSRTARWVALSALLLGACAYYNGLYNANHLADEARRAERQGRTGEARSLWSRAAVKAESVAARYPKSKYRDDALLLQGQALGKLGSCSQAVKALRLAVDSSSDPAIRTRARLISARCRLDMQEPESVLVVVEPVLSSGSAGDRNEALLLRGEAQLRIGNDQAALEDLAASASAQAIYPRAVALTRLGRPDEAAALLAASAGEPYRAEGWLPTLDTLGARAPALASGLVDRLADRPDLGSGDVARLRLADGERWLAEPNDSLAMERFREVARAVPDSSEGRAARAYLAVWTLAQARDVAAVQPLLDSLEVAMQSGGLATRIAASSAGVLGRVRVALQDEGDPLDLFVGAEEVRDSLGARDLAAALFAEVARRDPTSVLAPKALLALAVLRPASADSLVALLHERYPQSVYTLALAGEASDAYRALEDSLRRLIERGILERRRTMPGRRPAVTRDSAGASAAGRRIRNDR
jgi:hypothetical protein